MTSTFELPDAFFDVTVSDVRKLYQDLRNKVTNYDQAPLLTKEFRNLEESKKILNQLGLYKKCLLRIQFPDRYVIQSTFTPIETIQDVMNLVRKYLLDPEMDFYLCKFSIRCKIDEKTNFFLSIFNSSYSTQDNPW